MNTENPSVKLQDVLELPHNAWFDTVSGTVTFAIDRFTISFDIDEFKAFASQIDDISIVLKQMLVSEHDTCSECGSPVEFISVNLPGPEDYN
ncbi:MAG: hypothetical protein ACW96N_00090 [Candidatus Thorarchaeota archaeon]